jgi:hypothetical protein
MNKALRNIGIIISILVLIISYMYSPVIFVIQFGSMFLFYVVGSAFATVVVDYKDNKFDTIWRIESPVEKFFYYAFPILAFGKKILTKKY